MFRSFIEGYRMHTKVLKIVRKYDAPCSEAAQELTENGITEEDWGRLVPGNDKTLTGILYSAGGIVSWLLHSVPGEM